MNCNANISLFCTIGRSMRTILILLEKSFEENLIDLNLTQFIILNMLSVHDDLILEDLSKRLHKDKSAIMRHINHLECQYFVAKMPNNSDKRKKVLVLTGKGLEILEKARKVEIELQNRLTKNINKTEVEVLSSVMENIRSEANNIIKNT